MLKQKWLRYLLIAVSFILLGYFRHILLVHLNLALKTNHGRFEFPREFSQNLYDFFLSLGDFARYLEIGLQGVFFLLYGFLSYYFLIKLLGFKAYAKTFLILFFGGGLLIFLLAKGFDFLHWRESGLMAKTLWVRLQGPLPFLVFFLLANFDLLQLENSQS
ncbi:MAG: hypothetical protein ACPF8V_10805 [Luteibaculum sp.]